MFIIIFLKELLRHLKNPSFYIFTAVIALACYLLASNLNPGSYIMGLTVGKEWHNAPILIAKMISRLSVMGILFTMVMVGRSVTRDFEANIHDFFFTLPLSKGSFLGGRFLGGISANILIFIGVPIGFYLGCLVIGPQYYGPFRISSFLLPVVFILLPNLLFIGSIFFSLATLSRRMVMTYLAGVASLMIYGLVIGGFASWENDTVKMLLDPFGIYALNILTKYWTVADNNLNIMPLNPLLLLNRLIWLTVTFSIIFFTWKRFRFVSVLENIKNKPEISPVEAPSLQVLSPVRQVALDESFSTQIKKVLHLVNREFRRIVFHPFFLILTFMAMSEIIMNFVGNVGSLGEQVYPMTSWFLQQTLHIEIYMLALTIFFSGNIIWKERDYRSNEFYDTLPLPNWLTYSSKLLTMMSIQLFYIILALFSGIITQAAGFGYTDFEPGLYFKHLFGITLLNLWFFTVLVFFVQNLVNSKILGFFMCAVLAAGDILIFEFLKFENYLFRFGHVPPFIYSNLNGFGAYGPVIFWYTIYWLLFCGILVILTSLLWRRNNEIRLRSRIKNGLLTFTSPYRRALAVITLLFLVSGGYIGYNKYIINQYLSREEQKQIQATYEKEYARYQMAPQPTITDIRLKVDIYPESRLVKMVGFYNLVNRSHQEINEIYVNLSDRFITRIDSLGLSLPASLIHQGDAYGFRIFRLGDPLLPEREIQLGFILIAEAGGFSENNPKNELAHNGTHFTLTYESPDFFPLIGYVKSLELEKDKDRSKLGLPQRPKNPPLESADRSTGIFHFGRATYDAVISTSGNQTVVSNGDLVKTWNKDGRNYFHYQSQIPMDHELVFTSAEYEVAEDEYAGIKIQVYFDKRHDYNIQSMIKGVKRAFDYCSSQFCPYPYRTVKIVEIPRYVDFGARSQPTVFTWSEEAGFINNFKPEDIDMVFAICTHEMAHQWWGYIVKAAYSEGSEMLSETMAMYVETMCLEKEYGKKISREFLKDDMDRYLRRRQKDVNGERPLMRSYTDQYYLNYPKSSVVMYALQDLIGENRVNQALRQIVDQYGFREDQFALSSDLVNFLHEITPDSFQYIITDLFETITLWENRADSARSVRLPDGRYRVDLMAGTHKFRSDSIGNQTEIPLTDYIDIGIFGENDQELYLAKHKFTENSSRISLVVDEKPVRAGIDPYVILIDRDRKNNTVLISESIE